MPLSAIDYAVDVESPTPTVPGYLPTFDIAELFSVLLKDWTAVIKFSKVNALIFRVSVTRAGSRDEF